jgi:hypothetical protein
MREVLVDLARMDEPAPRTNSRIASARAFVLGDQGRVAERGCIST